MFAPVNPIYDHEVKEAKKQNLYMSFKHTDRYEETCSGRTVLNVILKMNPSCSIWSFKKLYQKVLQLCTITDLPWWLCPFEHDTNILQVKFV